jgi:hypothetical protein
MVAVVAESTGVAVAERHGAAPGDSDTPADHAVDHAFPPAFERRLLELPDAVRHVLVHGLPAEPFDATALTEYLRLDESAPAQALRVPRFLSAVSCAAIRRAVELETPSTQADTTDSLPEHQIYLSVAELQMHLGKEEVGRLLALPAMFCRAQAAREEAAETETHLPEIGHVYVIARKYTRDRRHTSLHGLPPGRRGVHGQHRMRRRRAAYGRPADLRCRWCAADD